MEQDGIVWDAGLAKPDARSVHATWLPDATRAQTRDVTGATGRPIRHREAVPTVPLARRWVVSLERRGRNRTVRPSVVGSQFREVETYVQRN